QPRSAFQPPAARRLDVAVGRADPFAGTVRQSLVVDQPVVRPLAGRVGNARAERGKAANAHSQVDVDVAGGVAVARLRMVRADLSRARRSGAARPRRWTLLAVQLRRDACVRLSRLERA